MEFESADRVCSSAQLFVQTNSGQSVFNNSAGIFPGPRDQPLMDFLPCIL